MKKITLFFLLANTLCFPKESFLFSGMHLSKYGFLGVSSQKGYGAILETSFFSQETQHQYARAAVFYHIQTKIQLDGFYLLYVGSRYDNAFYDYGSLLGIQWMPMQRMIFNGKLQLFYDSDLGLNFCFSSQAQAKIFNDIYLLGGIKNVPEYRSAETRYFGGLSFAVQHLQISPYMSKPLSSDKSHTRISIDFLYTLPLSSIY